MGRRDPNVVKLNRFNDQARTVPGFTPVEPEQEKKPAVQKIKEPEEEKSSTDTPSQQDTGYLNDPHIARAFGDRHVEPGSERYRMSIYMPKSMHDAFIAKCEKTHYNQQEAVRKLIQMFIDNV